MEVMKAERILITRTDRLGDVVLSTPVIRFLRKKYPTAHIAMMVRPYTSDIVINNPDLNEVILYDKYHEQRGLWKSIKFALALRKKRFDVGIALHPTNRVHLMLFFAGVPIRIGYDKNLGKLLTKRVLHAKQKGLMHEADYNFNLLKEAGFDVSGADHHPYMNTGDDEKKLVDVVLADQGVGRDVIVLHAGASCPSKRWSPERFAKVADSLAGDFGCDIVLVGGSDAEKYNSLVAENMDMKVFDLTDMLRVGELAELLKRSKLLISNDSGPVHVATAVGTPVVCVFGRSDPGLSPKRWGPLGEKDIVLHKNVGCRECLAHNCQKDFACLKAITADEVITAAKQILNG
jgi:lipopolysaccharide heptosyltransferase II